MRPYSGIVGRLPASSVAHLREPSTFVRMGNMTTMPAPTRRLMGPVAMLIGLTWTSARLCASDMELSIEVKAGGQRVRTAQTEIQPSQKKPQPRPTCIVKAHQDFVVSWKATNTSKRDTFKDVTIHCVVVAENQPGQTTMPVLRDPVQESALWMDFKPGGTATGKFSLAIAEPGAYLLRVDTREMLNTHGHEHFAALDLICE